MKIDVEVILKDPKSCHGCPFLRLKAGVRFASSYVTCEFFPHRPRATDKRPAKCIEKFGE